jgi:hypothetical protein
MPGQRDRSRPGIRALGRVAGHDAVDRRSGEEGVQGATLWQRRFVFCSLMCERSAAIRATSGAGVVFFPQEVDPAASSSAFILARRASSTAYSASSIAAYA